MKIQVWDNGGITMDRYQVFINKHYFHMSFYADRANEVNQYGGKFESDMRKITTAMHYMKFDLLPKIPKNIRYAVRQRCKELRHENDS